MQGMYGVLGIARLLEASPAFRASDDRAMLDGVLLWTAHEIGADFEEKPVFNEQPVEKARRLGDRADVVVVAMSAAARPLAQELGALNCASSRIWDDATTPSPDWFERHRGLGAALQSGLAGRSLPTLKRKPKVGEFAFWVAEPGLPRVALSPDPRNAARNLELKSSHALGEIRISSVTCCYSWNFLFQLPPRDK
jgi:hypothetical protein